MGTVFWHAPKSYHINNPSRINEPVAPRLSACLTVAKVETSQWFGLEIWYVEIRTSMDILENGSKPTVSATNICGVLGSLLADHTEHLMIGSSSSSRCFWMKHLEGSRNSPTYLSWTSNRWETHETDIFSQSFLHILCLVGSKLQSLYPYELYPIDVSDMIFSLHLHQVPTPCVHYSLGPLPDAMSVSTRSCHGFCTIFGTTFFSKFKYLNYMYLQYTVYIYIYMIIYL